MSRTYNPLGFEAEPVAAGIGGWTGSVVRVGDRTGVIRIFGQVRDDDDTWRPTAWVQHGEDQKLVPYDLFDIELLDSTEPPRRLAPPSALWRTWGQSTRPVGLCPVEPDGYLGIPDERPLAERFPHGVRNFDFGYPGGFGRCRYCGMWIDRSYVALATHSATHAARF